MHPNADARDQRLSEQRKLEGLNLEDGRWEKKSAVYESIATSNSFDFNAIYKVQWLNHVDELLVNTATSGLCLCAVFTGSKTNEAAILPLYFPSWKQFLHCKHVKTLIK